MLSHLVALVFAFSFDLFAMQENAMKAHLTEQNKIYGEQNIVNLVNHKGYEKPVKEAFEKYVDKVSLTSLSREFYLHIYYIS